MGAIGAQAHFKSLIPRFPVNAFEGSRIPLVSMSTKCSGCGIWNCKWRRRLRVRQPNLSSERRPRLDCRAEALVYMSNDDPAPVDIGADAASQLHIVEKDYGHAVLAL